MTDIPEPAVKEWHTAQFLSSFSGLEDHQFGLVVLNQPIELEVGIFKTLWSRAKIRVCADGGANRLHQFNLDNQLSLLPEVVAGDFDSLDPSVRRHFEKLGVAFHHDSNEYSTDFDKALAEIQRHDSGSTTTPLTVLALGGLGGRVDQAFSLINQLYKVLPRSIFLISTLNISFLLYPGVNRIHAPRDVFGPCCGVIPISGPTLITLKGFRWDLENFKTEFGGFVSTSNEIAADTADVITDKHILWTIEFRGPDD